MNVNIGVLTLWHVLDAVIPAGAVVIAAIIGGRKLDAIHVLVNSQLTTALNKIASLEATVRELKK